MEKVPQLVFKRTIQPVNQKFLTREEKLKIIESHEAGKSDVEIAKDFSVKVSLVRFILRKKERYKLTRRVKLRIPYRSPLLDKVDNVLIKWIKENKQKGIEVSEAQIREKALTTFDEIKYAEGSKEKFTADQSWVRKLKHKVIIYDWISKSKESINSPSDDSSAENFKQEFIKIVEEGNYNPHQIFTVEEAGLYWKSIPGDSGLFDAKKNLSECKTPNDYLTLLLGSNAAGDLKLKPMIVHHSKTDTFKSYETDDLPVLLYKNPKGWLYYELFHEWFTTYFCPTVECYCQDQGLEFKVLLLLKSTPNHNVSDLNQNIKIVYLPNNVNSLIQPLSLGIIPTIKAVYVNNFLSQISSRPPNVSLAKFCNSYNIKNVINNISSCWAEINPEDLVASWHMFLPDIKIIDFKLRLSAIVHEIFCVGQNLGLVGITAEKIQSFINSPLQEFYTCQPEANSSNGVENMSSTVLNGLENWEEREDNNEEELSFFDLESIVRCIDTACETIVDIDTNVERSIKVRQTLQSAIQFYRKLYDEKTLINSDVVQDQR